MYSKHTGSMRVVQTEERGLDRKVINFFLCVFAKKYMGVVWDTEGGIPTVKVRKLGERPRSRSGNERSEGLELGVTELQGPRSMFGKGGPRPKALAKTPVLLTGLCQSPGSQSLPL